ncbi:ATP-binding protein [Alicyclobacillus sp. SO9]|uniref:ATP-binding protein n=1 Tax=Alicyclobacillus sp. SO9 TaxID=2665646 RepID=UPI001E5A4E34|nr:ATP-binding protein [Alicyclobacillus sp. SO9]
MEKIGLQSKPAFTNDAGEECCEFCQKPLPRHVHELFGKVRDFGSSHCKCPEAVKHKEKYDKELQRRMDEYDAAEHRHQIRQLIKQSMIPARWLERDFERFKVIDENRKAYEFALEYANTFSPSNGRGILLSGPVGVGKTHLAAAISLKLLEQEFRIVFGTVTSLLGQIRHTFDDSKEREADVFNRLTQCDLLVIDDIGKEKVTEWTEQTLFEIINSRYENNRSLVLTSNVSIADIRKRYQNVGDALTSRLLEMCQGIKMDGSDWRKKAVV